MANVFNIAKRNIHDSTWNMTTNTLSMMLVTTGPATNLTATEAVYADISACETGTFVEATVNGSERGVLAGLGYTTATGLTDPTYLDCNDVVFSELSTGGADIVGAIIVYSTATSTNDSFRQPVAYYDLADTTPNDNDFTVVIDAAGFLQLT